MNTRRLATVFMVTVGGVLIPGVAANAATTATVPTASADPIFVLAGGTSDPGSATAGADVATVATDGSVPAGTDSTLTGKDAEHAAHAAEEAAKKALHDAEEAQKKAQHDAEELQKKAAHDAEEAAKQAAKGPIGKPGPFKPMPTSSTNMSWTGNANLFDGNGRKFC